MKCKYDVFISYSRKDYEKDNEIIPGNPISKIQEAFVKNGISYWFDKDGIYSSQEFVEVISDAIAKSYILVFVSSVNSNESIYTTGEIFEALDGNKKIIPVRLDNCQYNKKFRMLIRPKDHIDYFENPDNAIEKLLDAINKIKAEIEQKEKEEEQKKQVIKAKERIKKIVNDYSRSIARQETKIKELVELNRLIGVSTKRCPVCGKDSEISSIFCEKCGWKFESLYGLDLNDNIADNKELIAFCKANHKVISNAVNILEKLQQAENDNKKLREEKQNLESQLCESESKAKNLQEEISRLVENIAELENTIKELSKKQENVISTEIEGENSISEIILDVKGFEFKMIKVDGGSFMMGATPKQVSDASDDEMPAHKVTLSKFYIGEVPVTQELWRSLMGGNPSIDVGDKIPVNNVSYYDCCEFIKKLNEETVNTRPQGMVFRLPTEAEWEYAARGGYNACGEDFKYAGSNKINEVAWYFTNSSIDVHLVRKKKPNQLGIYDMSGNVLEWCYDGRRTYNSKEQSNPIGPTGRSARALRGGERFSYARECRVSCRNFDRPYNRYSYYGLRLCLGQDIN